MAIASKGSCNLCGKAFGKAGMTRHLATCGDTLPSGLKGSFHLVVDALRAKSYWLHLAAPVDQPIKKVDRFLRSIWLECCGHLSMFRKQDVTYMSEGGVQPGDRTMQAKLGRVASPGDLLAYEYDFGSTTELLIKVAGLRGPTPEGGVQLLARNDDPGMLCDACGKAEAVAICEECERGRAGWLCEACADAQDCDEDMRLPVVNSPRAGVCGYTG